MFARGVMVQTCEITATFKQLSCSADMGFDDNLQNGNPQDVETLGMDLTT